MLRFVVTLVIAFVSIAGTQVSAHQDHLSFWKVEVEPPNVRSRVLVSLLDLDLLGELDADGDGKLQERELLRGREMIERRVLQHFRLRNEAETGRIEVIGFHLIPGGSLELQVVQRFSRPIDSLELESSFHLLTDDRHRVLCRVTFRDRAEQFLFDHRRPGGTFHVYGGERGARNWGRFFLLGVEHLFIGVDHLAFLLGLVVVGGTVGSLVLLITSFTVAHSVTLALAVLELVSLPEVLVEAAIALSICYIALENLFEKDPPHRWAVTFFIGLVHGLGFSHVLREMELPREELIASLLSFNLGVEVGQLAVFLVVLPLVFYLHRREWRETAVTATSFVILVAGLTWLAVRLLQISGT